ncbi:MAG: proline racemase family protein [Anaerolineae bacterium]|jgi:proline racemase
MRLDTRAFAEFENQLVTLDLHAGGEPIRLLIDGLPSIPGETINDKRLHVGEHLDQVRLLLTQEPRGHRDMFAGIITDPVSEQGDFGLVFMDARRYPYMCGHGIIGAVTGLIEMGWLEAKGPETAVVVDSPSGPIQACARVRQRADGRPRVESVAIRLESAFAFLLDQPLEVPGLGHLTVDVSFAGGFFVMIPADQIEGDLVPENAPQLARWGMASIEAGNQQLSVQHPTRTYIDTIDVAEFYDPAGHSQRLGRNFVVLGEGHVDRSPCGTGTSAKMALLHRRGELAVGQTFVNRGLLGTTFEGRIVAESTVGDPATGLGHRAGQMLPAIVPEIRGAAHVTGLHRFILTPEDPFPEGFLI